MLSFLRVRGIALLDDVALELLPGMNVLTGETGAGKSIIVDALALLRGSRSRPELLRAGEESATVEAQFEVPESSRGRVDELLRELGLPESDGGALVLRRTVPRGGRSRCFTQGELTTRAVLGRIGEELLDICSQHEHHSLTRLGHHLELLDDFAALGERLDAYRTAYRRYRAAGEALAALQGQTAEPGRAAYLRFHLEELERVAPEPGEREELKRRLALLSDAQGWAEFASRASDELYESDGAIAARLGWLADRARHGASHSARLAAMAEQLGAALAAVEDAAREASRLGGELSFEPDELERAQSRLHELSALERKHGPLDELGARVLELRRELDSLEHREERVAELSAELASLRADCVGLAQGLRNRRRGASRKLGRAVEAELAALHMPDARLDVTLAAASDDEPGPRGLDTAELLFSANRGEPPAPLQRVASGGELSRVLLAVKSVLSGDERVSTYVFDEVDAGVGGSVADAIGERLRRAAGRHQVLCITHLPQIAAYADAHFHVEKHEVKGRTVTRVRRLSDDDRVEELARMLGGAKVTDAARRHARELIEAARR